MRGLDMHAVIADEPGEGEGAVLPRLNKTERERGFAGSCRAADQHGPRADQNRRRVDGGQRQRSAQIAGRRTTKRAPSTLGPSGPSATPMRFSARMRPPCASTIWREIESPRPEFWPKP